jgi:hypothetical protein
MNEMQCDEDKIEYIQGKTQGENISQLPLYLNVSHLYISLLYMVSQ